MTPKEMARLGLVEEDLRVTKQLDLSVSDLDQIDLDTFRSLMGSLPTGVSIVTTRTADGAPRGLTCSAVCSVSATPPLLLVCVKSPSETLEAIHESSVFAVNVLAAGTAGIAKTFASPVQERFNGIAHHPGRRTGSPLLERTVARAECVLTSSHLAGDHQILVGRIVHGETENSRTPLAYWRAKFSEVQPVPLAG